MNATVQNTSDDLPDEGRHVGFKHETRLRIVIGVLMWAIGSLVFGSSAWVLLARDLPPLPADSKNTPTSPTVERAATPSFDQVERLVPGGEVVVRSADVNRSERRVTVDPFRIAETVVTNDQYYQFARETNHPVPQYWLAGEYPRGTATQPVTEVTLRDALDYCEWLSRRTGLAVSLPTEAEWEMAAHGTKPWKYPWGDQWDERAAASKEAAPKPYSVMSYPRGRSIYGVYDMVGSVWQWTSDSIGKDSEGQQLNVVKGGAFDELPQVNCVSSSKVVPGTAAHLSLGFRFIVRPAAATK